MSLLRDVLIAAYEAGVDDAELALVEAIRLERPEMVTLLAEDGTAIHTMLRHHGEKSRWQAPAPFFAVAVAAVEVQPYDPPAIRLDDDGL